MKQQDALALMREQGFSDGAATYLPEKYAWLVQANWSDVEQGYARMALRPSLREALEAAGFTVPVVDTAFLSRGAQVLKGHVLVATAESNNMARRIANALNSYTADDRGR